MIPNDLHILRKAEEVTYLSIDDIEKQNIIRVSAVIITYNEETIIEETLSKLWWCDEIIIVDSGSNDKTIDICKEYGCIVYFHPFENFSDQKKIALSKAKNDWILAIDADEVLTDQLIEEIRKELYPGINFSAFSIPRNLVFMNSTFRFGKESGSPLIRLFDRNKGHWNGLLVHERIIVNGPVKRLNHKIIHHTFKSYNHYLNKINLYSSLSAGGHKKGKKRLNIFFNVLSLPYNFFKYYFIDLNILNGFRGFAWSLLNTFYHFMKHLKINEQYRK